MLLAPGTTATAVTNVLWTLHPWPPTGNLMNARFSAEPGHDRLSFSMPLPGRHDKHAMGQRLDKLEQQINVNFVIIAVAGADDRGAERIVRDAAARHPHVITKPLRLVDMSG